MVEVKITKSFRAMTTDGTQTFNSFLYNGPLAARMACHMGDLKPAAICNLLGDQPLFYIDYVDHEEKDILDRISMDDPAISAEYYAENIEELQRRMARLEGASQHIDGYAREDVSGAFDLATSRLGHSSVILSLADLESSIVKTSMVSALYKAASAKGLKLVLSACTDTAHYDRDQLIVYINPRLDVSMSIMVVSRALREAWVHMSGAAIHPLHFAPEEAILLNRIQKADLAVTTIRAAWEMNLSGDKAAWARILTLSAYDLAVGFAREAIADFRSLNNGHAAHAAFERWFFSDRCRAVDRKLIQSMLADNHGLTFENAQVSRMVTGDVIARTGEMPVGKNYLSQLIEIILSDPLFTEVRDRSNANFLWFVKFERSFRASEDGVEQTLQPVPLLTAGSGVDLALQDGLNATPSVVPFTGVTRQKNQVNGLTKARDTEATVYYIDHFLNFSNR
jgi:hypothetical protein